jgi:endonuclease/exonuclease/phosphatase family metal-dependent hydrolase
MRVLALRVPAYKSEHRSQRKRSWEWLESTAASWRNDHAMILGDLNVTGPKPRAVGGGHLRRVLEAGWTRARPEGGVSFYGPKGCRSEIDRILATDRCCVTQATYVTETRDFVLAGSKGALSDHAALIGTVEDS